MAPPTPTTPPTTRRTAAPRGGLALVELVVALVVLAAIAVVAVPRLGRAEASDPGASGRGDLAVLRNAIELYAADHGGAYPPLARFEAALTQTTDGQGPYLQAIPGPSTEPPAVAGSPRVAAFPVPGPAAPMNVAATGGLSHALRPGPADWFYDEQTGRIRSNAVAAR